MMLQQWSLRLAAVILLELGKGGRVWSYLLRTVTRSLTASATSTFLHAFLTNRLDYCCSLYACRLGCLGRVLRSAARVFGVMLKFDNARCSPLSNGFHIGSLPWSGAVYSVFASVYLPSLT